MDGDRMIKMKPHHHHQQYGSKGDGQFKRMNKQLQQPIIAEPIAKMTRDPECDVFAKRRRMEMDSNGGSNNNSITNSNDQAASETAPECIETNARALIFELHTIAKGLTETYDECLMEVLSPWIPRDDANKYLEHTKGLCVSSRLRYAMCVHGIQFTLEAVEELEEKAGTLLKERLDKVTRHPALIPTLHNARKFGWRTAVIHKGGRMLPWVVMKKLGVDSMFKAVVTSQNFVENMECPYTVVYQEAARRLSMNPYRGIVICSTEMGVLGAKAAGMVSVFVSGETGNNEADEDVNGQNKKQADAVVADISVLDLGALLKIPLHVGSNGHSNNVNEDSSNDDKKEKSNDEEEKDDNNNNNNNNVVAADPSVGQECQAKYSEDGMWYRAEIMEINRETNQYRVQYTNYGNTEFLSRDCIAPLLL